MKDKKVTYFLIPLVAIVWGILIYKIISGISSNDSEINAPITKINIPEENVLNVDTFELLVNYRDPFLGKNNRDETSSSDAKNIVKTKPAKTVVKPIIPIKQFNFIEYNGQITNKGKNKVAILTISNESKLLNEGEKFQDFRLDKIYEDSIKIFYENQYVIIKKK